MVGVNNLEVQRLGRRASRFDELAKLLLIEIPAMIGMRSAENIRLEIVSESDFVMASKRAFAETLKPPTVGRMLRQQAF
jgi:hypothetical protein